MPSRKNILVSVKNVYINIRLKAILTLHNLPFATRAKAKKSKTSSAAKITTFLM